MTSRGPRRRSLQALEPLLLSYYWLRHSDRSVVTLANKSIDFSRDVALVPSRVHRQSSEPPMRLHIVDPTGTVQTFSRFNPLIYFCVYGQEAYYECLQLSLRSLAEHGTFYGTIGVACDRSCDDLIKHIPETFRDRLIVSEASADRGWFNRYCLDHGLYDTFQPILYCDIDVVFDADITDLLIDIIVQGQVCCAFENDSRVHGPPRQWDEIGNYFGKYLYMSDPGLIDAQVSLGNSGVIGFDNTGRVRVVNELVRMIASRQSAERLSSHTDQPILDYVLHKTELGNFQMLNKYCRLTRSLEGVPAAERCGMAHFNLASDAGKKAAMMRAYLMMLAQDDPTETRAPAHRDRLIEDIPAIALPANRYLPVRNGAALLKNGRKGALPVRLISLSNWPTPGISGERPARPVTMMRFRADAPVGTRINLVIRLAARGRDFHIRIRSGSGNESQVSLARGCEKLTVLSCVVEPGELITAYLSPIGAALARDALSRASHWCLTGILYFDPARVAGKALKR
jgi:hypothetical protein